MRTAIASILTVIALVGLAGCESSARPGASAMLGYRIDAARERSLWLMREGVLIHSAAARPKLVTLPDWIYAGPPHCPPDLAVGPKGEIVVTSNVLPTLWRIDPETLAVTVHAITLDVDTDKDVGFAAVVYSPEQAAFLVYSGVQRSVWKIDSGLKSGTRIARDGMHEARRVLGRRGMPCADLVWRLTHLASSID